MTSSGICTYRVWVLYSTFHTMLSMWCDVLRSVSCGHITTRAHNIVFLYWKRLCMYMNSYELHAPRQRHRLSIGHFKNNSLPKCMAKSSERWREKCIWYRILYGTHGVASVVGQNPNDCPKNMYEILNHFCSVPFPRIDVCVRPFSHSVEVATTAIYIFSLPQDWYKCAPLTERWKSKARLWCMRRKGLAMSKKTKIVQTV